MRTYWQTARGHKTVIRKEKRDHQKESDRKNKRGLRVENQNIVPKKNQGRLMEETHDDEPLGQF